MSQNELARKQAAFEVFKIVDASDDSTSNNSQQASLNMQLPLDVPKPMDKIGRKRSRQTTPVRGRSSPTSGACDQPPQPRPKQPRRSIDATKQVEAARSSKEVIYIEDSSPEQAHETGVIDGPLPRDFIPFTHRGDPRPTAKEKREKTVRKMLPENQQIFKNCNICIFI